MSQHSEHVGADTAHGDRERDHETSSADGAVTTTVRRTPSSAPAHPAPVLTVGHADDPAERQADAMADRVVARLDAEEPHRHTPGCGHLRRSVAPAGGATIGLEGGALDTAASSAIDRVRGGGKPLPGDVRRRMEGAFGTSLGHVRIHDGPQAAKLSSSMQASAFTTGSDVFFGAGQFDPASREGEHVLAHELAHVVTEGGAGVQRVVFRKSPSLFGRMKKGITGAVTAATNTAKKVVGSIKEGRANKAQAKDLEAEETKNHELDAIRGTTQREKSKAEIYQEPAKGETTEDREKRDEHVKASLESLNQRAQEMFEAEDAKLAELTDLYDGDWSEEEIALEAYAQTWGATDDEELRAHRPARGTAAEILVNKVRQLGGSANAQRAAVEETKEIIKVGQVHSKTVERAYERMVHAARRMAQKERDAETAKLKAAAKKAGKELEKKDEAPLPPISKFRKDVRPFGIDFCNQEAQRRKHKKARELPEEGGALDVAAWEAAEERVDARALKKQQDELAIERLQGALGANGKRPQPESDGPVGGAGGEFAELTSNVMGEGGGLYGTAAEIGEQRDTFFTIREWDGGPKAPKRDDFDTPRDDYDHVTDSVGAVGNVFSGLADAISETLALAKQVKATYKTGDPWKAIEATKAGLGAADGLVNTASGAAVYARSIQPSLSKEVSGFVPGLGVASAVMGTARAILDLAMAGRRQHETDTALTEARVRGLDQSKKNRKAREADVLVWPLLKMTQMHSFMLQNASWAVGKSIFDLVVSLGELGTLGGGGVPAAVKLGGTIADKAHDVGNFIYKEVRTAQANRAKELSSVQHLEGAAQMELSKHPSRAVDGLIVKAAEGDEIAMAYLCNYQVKGVPLTPEKIQMIAPLVTKKEKLGEEVTNTATTAEDIENETRGPEDELLLDIRDAVLAEAGSDADPESAMSKLRSTYESFKGFFGMREKYQKVKEMAEFRNAHAEDEDFAHSRHSKRGFGWKLKMMLKGEQKFGRSVAKTQILKDAHQRKEFERLVAAKEVLPEGVECAVGDKELPIGASPDAADLFFAELTQQEIDAELKAERDREPARNSEGWIHRMEIEAGRKQIHEMIKNPPKKPRKGKKSENTSQGTGGDGSRAPQAVPADA